MQALIPWVIYAGGLYVVWVFAFRALWGRWPMAYRGSTRFYFATDVALSISMWGYSIWLAIDVFRGRAIEPVSLAGGLVVVGLGTLLRLWTLLTLGGNWRMGQDPGDAKHEFVASGPYRFLLHPLNLGFIVVSIGQGLLTGFGVRACGLIVAAVAYYIVQGRVETEFWKRRRGGSETSAR